MTQYQTNFHETFPFSDTGAMIALAANTPLTYTVPGTNAQQYRALFSYTANANVWVSLNGTATVPTPGTSSASYNQEFRPIIRYVSGGDVLSFVSSDTTAQVGVSLLSLPKPA